MGEAHGCARRGEGEDKLGRRCDERAAQHEDERAGDLGAGIRPMERGVCRVILSQASLERHGPPPPQVRRA